MAGATFLIPLARLDRVTAVGVRASRFVSGLLVVMAVVWAP
jgi:hypothetical protein